MHFSQTVLLVLFSVFFLTSNAQRCGPFGVGVLGLDFEFFPNGNPVPNGSLNLEHAWDHEDWCNLVLGTEKPGSTESSWLNGRHPPQIFNSEWPRIFGSSVSNGDPDLGTPNQAFGGRGEGAEGGRMPGENKLHHNNILVVSEHNDIRYPDDEGGGGDILINFGRAVPIAFAEFIDIDRDEVDGWIELRDFDDELIERQPIQAFGENAYFRAEFNTGIITRSIRVHFPGSGGLASVFFCSDLDTLNQIGDFIWLDLNRNNLQEPYEWGVYDVEVTLFHHTSTAANRRLAVFETQRDGRYIFKSLPDDDYFVRFDISSVNLQKPFDWVTELSTPIDKNSDADPANNNDLAWTNQISVAGGVIDLTWDAGLKFLDSGTDCVFTPADLLSDTDSAFEFINEIIVGPTRYLQSDIISGLQSNSANELDQLKKYYFASILSISLGASSVSVEAPLEMAFNLLNGGTAPVPTSDVTRTLQEYTTGGFNHPANCVTPPPPCRTIDCLDVILDVIPHGSTISYCTPGDGPNVDVTSTDSGITVTVDVDKTGAHVCSNDISDCGAVWYGCMGVNTPEVGINVVQTEIVTERDFSGSYIFCDEYVDDISISREITNQVPPSVCVVEDPS